MDRQAQITVTSRVPSCIICPVLSDSQWIASARAIRAGFDQTAFFQAKAAGKHLLAGLRGESPQATFRVELICIIDALDRGTLIWRTQTRTVMLPPSRLWQWIKRGFERLYVRTYR